MDTNQNNIPDDQIDIAALVGFALKRWYYFAISVVVMFAVGELYLKRQTPLYNVTTSVLLKQEQSMPEEMLLLIDLGLRGGKNNIDNEIGLFKSADLITKIVVSQELYTTYRTERRFGFFYTPDLYKNSPYYVRLDDTQPENITSPITLEIRNRKGVYNIKSTYVLNKEEIVAEDKLESLPGYISLDIGRVYIDTTTVKNGNGQPIIATIYNPYSVAKQVQSKLNIATSTKQSSQLNFELRFENRRKGIDLLEALINEYNRDAIKDKNQIAYNTAVFIDERLKEISAELGQVEGQVESYRREHNIADIPTQVSGYIRQSEEYNRHRSEIETQLNLLSYIQEFISKAENKTRLIPNLGIKDPGLNGIIKNYNELLIEKNRIESSSSEDNPVLVGMNKQVSSLLHNIQVSLNNEMNASTISLRDLERQNIANTNIMTRLPSVDREFTEILRQQEVKSNLFIFLLQKREETNLTQAAVAPKAKVIEKARAATVPSEPKSSLILMAFFIVGLIIPAGVMYLRSLLRTKIESIDDLNSLKDITVIGDIIKVNEYPSENNKLVVEANNTSPVNEMFRTFRSNLLFMTSEEHQKVILVTSTIPKEGKTFIAANLAKSLTLLEKKVILVGADTRNPQISHTLGIPKHNYGFSSYLAGQVNSIDEVIEEIDNYFYILQSGPIPPNPNELLTKPRLSELINQLRERFDYIVIDSAPVGMVSDTFNIAKHADATVYVMSENLTEKDAIPFMQNLSKEKRLKNVAVVLNNAHSMIGRGGYKYKYAYSYSYKYRYGY